MLKKIKRKLDRLLLGKERSRYLNYILHHHENDDLVGEIQKSGNSIYEEHETPVLLGILDRFVRPAMLDIGANIGLITLNACAHSRDVKVYAIEPGPSQFKLLALNINENKLHERVSIFNIALSAENGEIDFCIHERQHSSGDGIKDTGRAGEASIVRVKSQTLDSWWKENERPKIDLVKIDTEGSELQILQNGTEFIEACRPQIVVEICDLNFVNYGLTYKDHLNFFDSICYELTDTKRQLKVREGNEFESEQYCYLATPKV